MATTGIETCMFERRLGAAAAAVERRLAAILDAEAPGTPARLLDAMRHAVLGGGKRFRPFLVIETAGIFGVPEASAVDVAAALELVHCYSLVHDDLPAMDNDELRRGRPTVWKAYDEWTAILAGDALLTLAFDVLARLEGSAVPPSTALALTRRLAIASGPRGMVGGQTIDLEADKRGLPERPTVEHITHLQSLKTGALLVYACEAGALLGGAGAAEFDAIARYGAGLGRAFQLSDDLLDARGDAAITGKAVGKDAVAGKATLVSLLGIHEAERALAGIIDDAVAALSVFGSKADALVGAARFMAVRDR